jgi:hypothetical protein
VRCRPLSYNCNRAYFERSVLIKVLELGAVLTASIFAGAALYINIAEHPARMLLDTLNATEQWAPSYKRATSMQAPLALLSLVAGVATWAVVGKDAWLLAALLIGAVVPFTFIGVMPTNRRLLSPDLDRGSPEARALLARWGRLHAVRTVLSLSSAAIYTWLIVWA